MPRLPRPDLLVLGALALLVLGVAVRAVAQRTADASPAAEESLRVEEPRADRVVVHVAGAVRRPGLYRLGAGARVADALARAGGVTRRGDGDALNLAAKVEDGRRILVPLKPSTAARPAGAGGPTGPSGAAASSAPAGATGAGAAVDLNTATPEQLDALDGVGPATAAKIIEYREQHGGFGSVDELGQIPGIGPKRLESLRAQVVG